MSKEIAYIGVDPGKGGCITIMSNNIYQFYFMPTHKVETGELGKNKKPKMKTEFHLEGVRMLLIEITKDFPRKDFEFHAMIEDVIGRQHWSSQNNFEFGRMAGIQQTVLAILGVKEIQFVRPQKWQKYMWKKLEVDIIKIPSKSGKTMVNDTKETSFNAVKKHWPHINFGKKLLSGKFSKNFDDNKVDSFLIMRYLYEQLNK